MKALVDKIELFVKEAVIILKRLAMYLTRKKLQRQTVQRELPHYYAFEKACNLSRYLMREIGKEKFSEYYKVRYFLMPGIYLKDEKVDATFYKLAVILNTLVIYTKKIYEKNGINFDSSQLLSEEVLLYPLPRYERKGDTVIDVMELKGVSLSGYREEHCLSLAATLLERIETEFYFMRNYDMLHIFRKQVKFMKTKLAQIKHYANLGKQIADIIDGYDLTPEAGAIKSVMDELIDSKRLYCFLQREDLHIPFIKVIKLHAWLKGLNFNDDFFAFTEIIGPEINVAMYIAELYYYYFNVHSSLAISGKERLVIPYRNALVMSKDGTASKKAWEEDWVELICESIRHDDILFALIKPTKSIFYSLEEKIEAFGVPHQIAKRIYENLSFNTILRQNSHVKEKDSLSPEEVYQELYNPGKNFAAAEHRFMEARTGHPINRIWFSQFDEEEGTEHADAINTMVFIAQVNNGKIKTIANDFSQLTVDKELMLAHQQFAGEDCDIYIGENQGVCFLFHLDSLGSIFNAPFSIIEVKNNYSWLASYDRLAASLSFLGTTNHEYLHGGQVGSRIKWRDLISAIAEWIYKFAAKQLIIGRLDTYFPEQRIIRAFNNQTKTCRQVLIELLDIFTCQALGNNESGLGQRMREIGVTHALWEAGIAIDNNNEVIVEELKNIIVIEDSLTAKRIKATISALSSNDINELLSAANVIGAHTNELDAIVETSANAFSLVGSGYFLKNFPDDQFNPDNYDFYYDSLYLSMQRRGQSALVFQDLINRNLSTNELNKALSQYGLKYQQIISSVEHTQFLKERLVKLGYNPLDPYSAYDDLGLLKSRVKAQGLNYQDFLRPINAADASIGLRYETNIELLMEAITVLGEHDAYELFMEAESFQEISNCITSRKN